MHSTAWMNLTCHAKRNKADTKGRTVRGRTQTSLPRLARAAVGKGMPWLARPTGEGPAARSVPGQDSWVGAADCPSGVNEPQTFSTTSRPPTGQGCSDVDPRHFPKENWDT